VNLARLIGLVLPDGVSPGRWVASLAAALFVCLLCTRLLRTRDSLAGFLFAGAAAAFVLSSPLVLFFAVANLTYVPEAALWVALLVAIAARPHGAWLTALGFAIGLGAGLRQTIAVWGAAVLLIEALRSPGWIGWKDVGRLALAYAAGVAAWLVPMVIETGGWGPYVDATDRLTIHNIWTKSVFAAPPGEVLSVRVPMMLGDLWRGMGPSVALVLLAVWWRLKSDACERLRSHDALLLGSLVAFVFYLLVIYDSPGYSMPYVLGLFAYGLLSLQVVAEGWSSRIRLGAAVGVFALVASQLWLPGGLATRNRGDYGHYELQARMLEPRLETIRRRLPPDRTLLVTSLEYWTQGFRHVMYYMPEYTTLQLAHDFFFVASTPDKPYLTARNHRVGTTGPEGMDLSELGFEHVVYVFPHDAQQFVDASCVPYFKTVWARAARQPILHMRLGDGVTVQVASSRLLCRDARRKNGPTERTPTPPATSSPHR
jgi:hypothetical protein